MRGDGCGVMRVREKRKRERESEREGEACAWGTGAVGSVGASSMATSSAPCMWRRPCCNLAAGISCHLRGRRSDLAQIAHHRRQWQRPCCNLAAGISCRLRRGRCSAHHRRQWRRAHASRADSHMLRHVLRPREGGPAARWLPQLAEEAQRAVEAARHPLSPRLIM